MKPKRTYIAGPMTRYPEYNYPAFHAAAKAVTERGDIALNPADSFGGDQTRTYSEYMRAAIGMVLRAEVVVFLPGWEASRGARMEWVMADALGLPCLDAASLRPVVLPCYGGAGPIGCKPQPPAVVG